jgi:hypothetical protein
MPVGSSFKRAAIGVFALLLAAVPNTARGQIEPYAAKGKLLAIEPGLLVLQTQQGRQAIKFLKPGGKQVVLKAKGKVLIVRTPLVVQIKGEISPSHLTPGTLVRFSGALDKDGNVTSDVGTVTALLDPKRDERAGLFPDQAGGEEKSSEPRYLIKGTILRNKKGLITVNVGVKTENTPSRKVVAQLTDLTAVHVEGENLARIRVGDELEIEGVRYEKNEIAAEKIVAIWQRSGKPIGNTTAGTANNKPEVKKEPADNDTAEDNADKGEKKKKKGKTVIVN